MILIDSSVWIDYLRKRVTWQTEQLNALMSGQRLAIGDLALAEVLQGCRDRRHLEQVLDFLSDYQIVTISGIEIAIEAARNYLKLRSAGITIRKTINGLIATRCIHDGYTLLHSDRDFDPFAEHLGLQVVTPA